MASISSFNPQECAHLENETLPNQLQCTIILIFNISDSKEKILEDWKYCNDPNTAPFERVEHANRPVIYGIDLDALEIDNKPNGPGKVVYKLLLQDSEGHLFYGLEIDELPFLHPQHKTTKNPLPIPLGGTLVLHKDTIISYGLMMLRMSHCHYTGADVTSDFSQKLNGGLVQKYIEMLDRELHGKSN